MFKGLAGRNLGSESSAWYAVGVLAVIQLTFNFVAPQLARWAVPYAGMSAVLCLMAVGVAMTSLEGVVKRGIAIAASLLLLLLSLSHLATAKAVPIADISVSVPEPSISVDDQQDGGGDQILTFDPEMNVPKPLATFNTVAEGIAVESRIDQVGHAHRMSWRLTRGAETLRCGPIFVGGTREQAEELLQTRLAASLVSSDGAKLFCE